MRRILFLAFAVMAVCSVSAQVPIDSKSVPQTIQKVFSDMYSVKALKYTQWVKIEHDYEVNYEKVRLRIDEDARLIWVMDYLDHTELPKVVYDSFKKKYDSFYLYESAWAVTQHKNGEKLWFVVGMKGTIPYYFKYDEQYKMVEKVACAMDFEYQMYRYKPKPKPAPAVVADTLTVTNTDSSLVPVADTARVQE